MLNHHNLGIQLGYNQLAEVYSSMEKEEIENQIEEVLVAYTGQIKDKPWSEFKVVGREIKVNGFNKVYKLYDAIQVSICKNKQN